MDDKDVVYPSQIPNDDRKPPESIVREISKIDIERVLKDTLDKRMENYYVPFKGSAEVEKLYMLYILEINDNDCSAFHLIDNFIGGYDLEGEYMTSWDLLVKYKEQIAEAVVRCYKRGKIVALPLDMLGGKHRNMLIFNYHREEVEHYEPHGWGTLQSQYRDEYNAIQNALKVVIKEVNKKSDGVLNFKRLYAPQISKKRIINEGQWREYQGFQYYDDLEEEQLFHNIVITSSGGYCVAWSYFYLNLRLKFPDISGADLVSATFDLMGGNPENKTNEFTKLIVAMTNDVFQKSISMVKKGYLTFEELVAGFDGASEEASDKLRQATDKLIEEHLIMERHYSDQVGITWEEHHIFQEETGYTGFSLTEDPFEDSLAVMELPPQEPEPETEPEPEPVKKKRLKITEQSTLSQLKQFIRDKKLPIKLSQSKYHLLISLNEYLPQSIISEESPIGDLKEFIKVRGLDIKLSQSKTKLLEDLNQYIF